jgi:hypothetical protein
MERDDAIIDLGDASLETKGFGMPVADTLGGRDLGIDNE